MALTAKDLIKNKEIIKDRKNDKIEIEVDGYDKPFLFSIPDVDVYDDAQAYAKTRGDRAGDKYIIVECCVEPNLRDPELLAAYEVKEATDLIDELFRFGDVASIIQTLLKFSGFKDEKEVNASIKKAKN